MGLERWVRVSEKAKGIPDSNSHKDIKDHNMGEKKKM